MQLPDGNGLGVTPVPTPTGTTGGVASPFQRQLQEALIAQIQPPATTDNRQRLLAQAITGLLTPAIGAAFGGKAGAGKAGALGLAQVQEQQKRLLEQQVRGEEARSKLLTDLAVGELEAESKFQRDVALEDVRQGNRLQLRQIDAASRVAAAIEQGRAISNAIKPIDDVLKLTLRSFDVEKGTEERRSQKRQFQVGETIYRPEKVSPEDAEKAGRVQQEFRILQQKLTEMRLIVEKENVVGRLIGPESNRLNSLAKDSQLALTAIKQFKGKIVVPELKKIEQIVGNPAALRQNLVSFFGAGVGAASQLEKLNNTRRIVEQEFAETLRSFGYKPSVGIGSIITEKNTGRQLRITDINPDGSMETEVVGADPALGPKGATR